MALHVPQEVVEEATAELDRVRDEWQARPEVTALYVGLAAGGTSPEVAIHVHVRRLDEAVSAAFPPRLGRFPVLLAEVTYGAEPG